MNIVFRFQYLIVPDCLHDRNITPMNGLKRCQIKISNYIGEISFRERRNLIFNREMTILNLNFVREKKQLISHSYSLRT